MDSQKKKKKKKTNTKSEIKLTHRTHGQVASRESRENQILIHWYNLYRAKAKQTKTNTMFIKKKKKKNPNTEPLYQNDKTKPKKPQIPNSRSSSPYLLLVIVVVGRSSLLSS